MDAEKGLVYLVGAGPGDPGLLTRRGAEALAAADLVVYDGLLDPALLALAPHARAVYAGKKRQSPESAEETPLDQDQINSLLVDAARKGEVVVRLKGGDPFVFGRGAEEAMVLRRAGVRFEIVPGVSAATAVAAYAGIPLTARGHASTALLVTGHEAEDKDAIVDWAGIAGADTIVLFMAWRRLPECVAELLRAGRSPDDPAAAIYWGTTVEQRTVISTLAELTSAVEEAGLRPPTLIVIGPVVLLREQLSWYETRPLFGRRILITRAIERSEILAHELSALGGQTLGVPVTRTTSLVGGERQRLQRALAALGTYDWAVFTSENAVAECFAVLGALELDARSFGACRVAAVGPATARALAEHGIRADCVPERRDGSGLAEAMATDGSLDGSRVIFPRAREGSDSAIQGLQSLGASVDLVPAYATEQIAADDSRLATARRRLLRGQIHAVAFFAPSQVDALFSLVPEAEELLKRCKVLAAIGRTTARALEARGLPVHVIPEFPDLKLLARGIANALVAE